MPTACNGVISADDDNDDVAKLTLGWTAMSITHALSLRDMMHNMMFQIMYKPALWGPLFDNTKIYYIKVCNKGMPVEVRVKWIWS